MIGETKGEKNFMEIAKKDLTEVRCKICDGPLSDPSYRRLFHYVNFPAHKNWAECAENLTEHNFEPIYNGFPELVELAPYIDPQYDDVVNWIHTPSERLELLLQSDRLGEMINNAFPVVDLKTPSQYIPVEVRLPIEVMAILVAHELTLTEWMPSQLKHTTAELFEGVQKGQLPYSHRIYNSPIPAVRNRYVISVPANMEKALNYQWIRKDLALERALWVYSERIVVPGKLVQTAHSVLQNRITPQTMKRRTRRAKSDESFAPMSCLKPDNLPKNKKSALKSALNDPTLTPAHLKKILSGVKTKKVTTLRVDFEDEVKIRQLSAMYGLPVYKLITALILSQSEAIV